ncbi:MAG: DNA repair protein RadA [Bacillota bacterium]
MSKSKTVFVCQECGYESARWLGRCPSCNTWSSLQEERLARNPVGGWSHGGYGGQPQPIDEIEVESEERLSTGFGEFDRVLGGGIVPGSLVLVGGDPGIGKSTLLLQAAAHLGREHHVLYVSGEESAQQIKLRATRIDALRAGLSVLAETDLDQVGAAVDRRQPTLMIVDSIQTVHLPELTSAPGSVSQVREGTSRLMRWAKGRGISVFLVGHVTKEGAIAGPRVVEHMVDTVLYFESNRDQSYRVLRSVKNRYGSTNELGVFQMTGGGLTEVTNPSALFLEERPTGAAGSVVVACLEGTRPVLIELQALVSATSFGYPRRVATGLDLNRVALIMAVLEKKVGLSLGNQDAYLKVAGGLRVEEPALDLGIAVAVASSFRERPVSGKLVVMGEVGLAGEVRAITGIDSRLREAEKMGFAACLVPEANRRSLPSGCALEVAGVRTVEEAIALAMEG